MTHRPRPGTGTIWNGRPSTQANVWVNGFFTGEAVEFDLTPPPRPSPTATLGYIMSGTGHARDHRMPYATNTDLPIGVRKNLPQHAQDIYRAAFNAAYERYGPGHEDTAHRIAWAAVKRSYVQRGAGIWVRRPRHE
jgi:cation transport regulator